MGGCFKVSIIQVSLHDCQSILNPQLFAGKLKELVLESHVRLGLETDASAEDVDESAALLGKSIDNRGARGGKGSLEHVAENAQNAVEALEVLGGGTVG